MVTQAERLESINRINILERGEEAVARGDITQNQFDESLRIFNETKSMDAANEYLKNERKKISDKDSFIMKAEKQRRARAKNKANPMGKKYGGIVKMSNGGLVPSKYKGFSKLPEPVQVKIDSSLATKYNDGGMVKKNKPKNNYKGQSKIQVKKVKFKGVY
tara:strand:- start:32 stop:514 length:483 start_codon:yes stop_codon:yes gene_type:complete